MRGTQVAASQRIDDTALLKATNGNTQNCGHSDIECTPTLVSIDLAYEFANPAHAGVAASFFGMVSKMMVSAFEDRLLRVYGPGFR